MKWILVSSLILNVVLAVKVLREPAAPVFEKVIIESHKQIVPRAEVHNAQASIVSEPAVPEKNDEVKKESKKADMDAVSFSGDEEDVGQMVDQVESKKHDFLTVELGLSEEEVTKLNKIKEDFYKRSGEYYQKNPMGELSFQERRELLMMEEKFHQDMRKTMGSKKWDRYEKFREQYNQRASKRHRNSNTPIFYMSL